MRALLDRLRPAPAAAPARAPDGVRLYAVGDIHGRLDLFDRLLERVRDDHLARLGPAAHLVLLGDYIDRGPRSAQVLDRVADGPPAWATWTTLRGNHEQSLLDILSGRDRTGSVLEGWLGYGGRATMLSYGVPAAVAEGDDRDAIRRELDWAVPARHREAIAAMPLCHRSGGYFFAHAGVRPGAPLDRQREHDLLWIREPFLASRADHGATVVHGHSISPAVEDLPNRINVDTGAYATGRLTAAVLEGADRRFLSTLD